MKDFMIKIYEYMIKEKIRGYKVKFDNGTSYNNIFYLDMIITTDTGKNYVREYYSYEDRYNFIKEYNDTLKRIYNIKPVGNVNIYIGECPECATIRATPSFKKPNKTKCERCLGYQIKEQVQNVHMVYLMQSELTGLLKIGTTQNIKKKKEVSRDSPRREN